MKNIENVRKDIAEMMSELRHTMEEIGEDNIPQASVVNNARDRLRFISALTEQAAGRTLTAAENVLPKLRAQQAMAAELAKKTRSPEMKAFLEGLQADNEIACAEMSEIIQAQTFQDLVGQVVNKLAVMVRKMEDSLAHLLIDDEEDEKLSGPQVREEEKVSQEDIDDLFG